MDMRNTDISNILIIGCGGAGLRAAIEAKNNNLSVKILGKRNKNDAQLLSDFDSLQSIHTHIEENSGVFILLGEGKHKIKKKAEQIACEKVIEIFDKL